MKKLLRPVRFLTKNSLILLAWAFTPALFFLIVVAVLASINDIDFYMLSVEPMEIFKAEPYIGLLSNVGIIVMSASSAILLYSSFVSRRQDGLTRNASFLLWVGLFTFVLLVDDLFMFHEKVLPAVFGTYLVEPMLYGLYALSALLVLYFYYDIILDTYFVVFLAALIFYGMSICLDLIDYLGITLPNEYLFEDGFKFLGTIGWCVYFIITSYNIINKDKLTSYSR